MFVRALLREGKFGESSAVLEHLPTMDQQSLKAFIAFKSGRREEAMMLLPSLKETLCRTETPQVLQRGTNDLESCMLLNTKLRRLID